MRCKNICKNKYRRERVAWNAALSPSRRVSMEKRYGFFGGCFNPITNAHLNLANLIVEKYNLDKLVFVPMGDKYQKLNLANERYRYEMLKIATKSQEKLEVSDIELNLPNTLTMLEAFKKIEKQYSKVKPYFIIGADNLAKLIRYARL